MGIKDNFQQALRELTGTEKEEPKRTNKVDAMKSAVSASDDTGEFDAVRPQDDASSYDEIQRRAAAAADEYNRQQSAYQIGNYQPGAPDVPPPPQDMNFTGDTVSAPAQKPVEENETLTLEKSAASYTGGMSDFTDLSGTVPPYGTAQTDNSASRRNDPSVNYESANISYQNQVNSDNRRKNPNAKQLNMGGYGNDSYSQNYRNYQQSTGGYNPNMSGYRQQTNQGSYQSGNFGSPDPANEQQSIFSAARYARPAGDDDEITVISRNTVIDGNVRSFANMSVDGNVKGNIETTKDIDLNGKVVGNIACNNAQMRTSQIQGNIQMKGNAYMERDTLLIGDLTSTYANVNGKIKGNLDITGKAELKSDAVVFGDISASTITVNDGAIIQGYVSTTFLNKEESRNIFPDTITIGD